MLRSIGLCIGLFLGGLLAGNVSAAVINPDNYTIYYGDLNADGASDYYFAQKPLMLVLHGDIAITLPIKRNDHFAIYRSGDIYSNAQAFALTDAEVAQRLSAGTLRLAVLNSDFFLWERNGENYAFLRGADASAPAVFLKSQSNNILPTSQVNYPVATYPQISNRNYPLAITDINNDGYLDVVLGSGDINSTQEQTAYLANNSGIPATEFEVTPAATAPSLPIDSGSGIKYHVGTIGGQFRVDESGAATYNIPIQLPEGVAGVTPQVALNYSSQAGVGLLGKGWSLSAYSGISRCRKTLSQDNDVKPITWTDQDRFCLDGQRLIVVSGTYGAVNSQYKTEIDSYARITAVGGTAGHPSYFKVEGKDGSVSYYGRTNNAKIYGSSSAIATTTLTWALSRFEDNVGNGIDYAYTGDSTTGHRLDYISYAYSTTSKNPSTIPQSSERNAKVAFFYEAGTSSSAYVAGYEFKNTQRLKRIEVSNNGQEVRRYVLGYMATANTEKRYDDKISRLEMIRECKGTGDCLAPMTFLWGGGIGTDYSIQSEKIDFPTISDDRYLLNHSFADLTGDGKLDLVYLIFNESKATSSLPNKAVISVYVKYASENTASSISLGTVDNYQNIKINTLDYNADGRQDLAIYNGTQWKIYLSTIRAVSSTQQQWRVDNQSTIVSIASTTLVKDTIFVDMDSNGLVDAVDKDGYRPLVRNTEPSTSNKAYSFGNKITFTTDAVSSYPVPPVPQGTFPIATSSCNQSGNAYAKLLPEHAGDFNGDGEMDFVVRIHQQYICTVYSTGGSGGQTTVYPLGTADYPVVYADGVFRRYGQISIPAKPQFLDINSDGLTDIVSNSGANYSYRINNGIDFGPATSLITFSSDQIKPQFLDYNGDGWTDLVWQQGSVLKVRLWGDTVDTIVREETYGNGKDAHFLMDVSGDGVFDYLRVTNQAMFGFNGAMIIKEAIPCQYPYFPGQSYNGYSPPCVGGSPAQTVPDDQQHNAIYEIHNGLGAVTKIKYGTLANSGHYATIDVNPTINSTQVPTNCSTTVGYMGYCPSTYTAYSADASSFYQRLNEGWPLPTGHTTLDGNATQKGSPVLEVNGPMQIVTSVESSAPIAGNANARSKVSYYYGEAKMQAKGRGFLGFHKLKTVDEQTQVTTVSTYRQDYPFSGSPLATLVYKTAAPDAIILSSAFNTWEGVATPSSDSGNSKYYQLKLKKSEEQSFDYTDGALLQTVTTDSTYDDYGNLTDSTVVTAGKKADGSATSLTKVTDNIYGSTVDEQRLGRLSSTTVTTTRDNEPSQTRSSAFTYYAANDSKGAQYLLKTEKVNAANLATTTTIYEYDAFGNKAKVITEVDADNKRSVTYDYGTTGRYLLSTTNDLEQVATIDDRDVFGNIKKATDINGIESKVFYDAMGGEYLRKDSTGAWSRTDAQYCSSSIACPTGASYRIYKRVAGGGKAYEYYDMLGRVIRSTKISFDGTPTHVDTAYDNLSRTKRQSVPFTGETAQFWTENTYDNLGRVTEVKAPDASISTSTYSGNTTIVTNALSQTRTEYRNGLGQLVKVKDHLNGTIEYDYDLNGNLTKAKTTADSTSVSVRICYDELGRKVAMHDPDKGGFKGNATLTCAQVASANPKATGWWYYSYNAYGELVEQTDPKGQRTKNYYDKMGRMVGRIDYLSSGAIEGFTQWFYEGGVGTHTPAVQGKLTAVVMNTASGLTTDQAQAFITSNTASCTEASSSCHKTLHDFDIYTRPITTTVYYPGSSQAYTARTNYDFFGRAYKQYDALDGVVTDTNGKKLESGVQTHYNNNGYAYKTTDIATGLTLQATQAVNVLGQVTQEYRGNGLTSFNTYDIKTGLLTNQKTENALGLSNVQNNVYGWDLVGNLKYRQNLSGKPGTPSAGNSSMNSYAQSESFCYDGLNRLIKTNANTTSTSACSSVTSSTQDVRYDGHGNIKYKKGVGDYTYASGTVAGPHAVTTAGGVNYAYDANGNNTSGDGRTLTYTSYDMVKRITKGSNATEFQYGPDRARWQRKDFKGATPTTTTYMGNVERIQTPANTIEWKRNVAGVVLTYKTDTSNNLQSTDKRYIYTDHLGSVDLMTDAVGEVNGQYSKITHGMSFDPWGARRNIAQWDAATFAFALSSITASGFLEPITRRGFTGHEMVDDMGIIHMNGRIYDAKLGRFLQADPFIQAAANTQSYNRYSYVLNNPLNANDPSGFFFSALKKLWNKIRPFVGAIVAVVLTVVAPWGGGFWATVAYGAIAGAAGAAANGGNIIKGALTGAVSAAAFYGVGQAFQGVEGAGNFMDSGLKAADYVAKVFAHGMVGGVMSVLQGGKFGHGFASAGVAQAFSGTIDGIGGGKLNAAYFDAGNRALRVVAAAVLGGTTSVITGGKFANGAITGAFSRAFNDEADHRQQEERNRYEEFAAKVMRTIEQPPALPQGLVDFAAGWGDTVSFGLTSWVRSVNGIDGGVSNTADYYSGMAFGAINSLATGWTAGLNGGARSVFWSGGGNLERAMSLGVSLESTFIGGVMNKYGAPYLMWKAASWTYAQNATGLAIKVGMQEGRIWSGIERSVLQGRGVNYVVVP